MTPFALEIYSQQKWTGWSKLNSGASNVEFGVVIVCGTPLSSLLLAEMECNLRWEEWVPGYPHCLLQFHRAACKQGKDCSRRQPYLEISMLDRNRLSSNHILMSEHRRAGTQACMHTDTHTHTKHHHLPPLKSTAHPQSQLLMGRQ